MKLKHKRVKLVRKRQLRTYSSNIHNIVRRRRYDDDEQYREEVKDVSRRAYRKHVKKELENCLRSLDFFEDLASVERVKFPDGKLYDCPVMNVPTTAKVLQKLYQTVWRWIKNGMLPEPFLEVYGTTKGVYHVDEIRVFIEVLGEHEKLFAYYRNDHTSTKNKLFDRVNLVREKLGESNGN